MEKQASCKERIAGELTERLKDIRKLWRAYLAGQPDKYSDELGSFTEYGLAFDYVPAGTFDGQKESYYRWQLSWGGPSDEFRFYTTINRGKPNLARVDYVFLDWFDGASVTLRGKRYELLAEIWRDYFQALGMRRAARHGHCIQPGEYPPDHYAS